MPLYALILMFSCNDYKDGGSYNAYPVIKQRVASGYVFSGMRQDDNTLQRTSEMFFEGIVNVLNVSASVCHWYKWGTQYASQRTVADPGPLCLTL